MYFQKSMCGMDAPHGEVSILSHHIFANSTQIKYTFKARPKSLILSLTQLCIHQLPCLLRARELN